MIYLKDVVSLQLNKEKCSGCGMCMVVCPHAVFSMNNGRVHIENRDGCMECGACAMNCPTGALNVQSGVVGPGPFRNRFRYREEFVVSHGIAFPLQNPSHPAPY